MGYFPLIGLVSAIVLLAWFLQIRIPPQLRRCFRENAVNAKVLDGIRKFLKLPDHESSCRLRRWTWWANWHDGRTFGQLNAPGAELFPVLQKPLPLPCLYQVGPCPALVHPLTGVVFGLRVGSYLGLLRLPETARQKALAENAAWPRSPLPALREHDLAELFGPEWVVANQLHPSIRDYYVAAFEDAGSTNDSQEVGRQ